MCNNKFEIGRYIKNKIISLRSYYVKKKRLRSFKKYGENISIAKGCIISHASMVEFGNNVSIGPNAVLYSIYKKIIFGNNVIVGPGVTIVSGDHNFRKIGVPIINNKEKLPEDDADIIIEDEVWIGANVTVLKGVVIGRGSVVAAGAVLTKSFPPYSIIGGVPAKIIGVRFSIDQIQEHESFLYSIDNRTPVEQLKWIINFKNVNVCLNQD